MVPTKAFHLSKEKSNIDKMFRLWYTNKGFEMNKRSLVRVLPKVLRGGA